MQRELFQLINHKVSSKADTLLQEIPDKVHGSHIHNHQSDNAPVHVDSITVQHD